MLYVELTFNRRGQDDVSTLAAIPLFGSITLIIKMGMVLGFVLIEVFRIICGL